LCLADANLIVRAMANVQDVNLAIHHLTKVFVRLANVGAIHLRRNMRPGARSVKATMKHPLLAAERTRKTGVGGDSNSIDRVSLESGDSAAG